MKDQFLIKPLEIGFPKVDYSHVFHVDNTLSEILKAQFNNHKSLFEQISKPLVIPVIPVLKMTEILQSLPKPFELNVPKIKNPLQKLGIQLQQNTLAHLSKSYENPILASMKQLESLNQGVLSSLKYVNDSFAKEMAQAVSHLRENPELLTEIIAENSQAKHNPYITRVILEFLRIKAPELFQELIIIPLALSIVLYKPLERIIDEKVVSPNICIARSGCRIREDGMAKAKIKIAIPSGTEILVLEDRGRWKKVFWQNEQGESYEGWTAASLLEWKWKKVVKGEK